MQTEGASAQALEEQLTEVLLLTERHQLERAQDLAQSLLLHHPNSAAVHAAMAEVAAARHQHREAIEWYELALRLEPNQRWRERLSRERDLLDEERVDEFTEALPPARNPRKLLLAGIGAGVALLLLIVLLVGAMRGDRGPARRTDGLRLPRPTQRAGAPLPVEPSPAAERPAGRAVSRAGGARTYPDGRREYPAPAPPSASGAPPLRITQNVEAPMADRDILLSRALGSLTWPSGAEIGQDLQAVLDPFTGYSLITLRIPPGTRRSDLYPLVMDMAWKLSVAAVRSDQGVDTMTIRVLADVENEERKTATLVAFRGNTSREAIDYYVKRSVQPDRQTLWTRVFATTWWNPSVPTTAAQGEKGG